MASLFAVIGCIFLVLSPIVAQNVPASIIDLCTKTLQRHHNKDMFPDPTDCHYFYHCFFLDETTATAIRGKCAEGLFWHDDVLSCMPEGETKCQDRCLDDATSAKGCFAGIGCRQFFICANTGSYGMCCPRGTSFSEPKCECVDDPLCNVTCRQRAPLVPTSVAPPEPVNATVCKDSYGAIITPVPGEKGAYYLLDALGKPSDKMPCPATTAFNLVTCRCDIEDITATLPPVKPKRLALFWAPFDKDTKDHSRHKLSTFIYDGAEIDTSSPAMGSGALRVNGGYISLPGLKSMDVRNAASFCAFFKCNGGACTTTGGILSNYKAANEFTVAMGVNPANTFSGQFHLWHPVGAQAVKAPIQSPANGWNHVCLTYNGNAIRLYMNGAVADTQFTGGYLSMSSLSMEIGRDLLLGSFAGSLDDVLITGFAMTQQEIDAHRKGDLAFLNAQGFSLGEETSPNPVKPKMVANVEAVESRESSEN